MDSRATLVLILCLAILSEPMLEVTGGVVYSLGYDLLQAVVIRGLQRRQTRRGKTTQTKAGTTSQPCKGAIELYSDCGDKEGCQKAECGAKDLGIVDKENNYSKANMDARAKKCKYDKDQPELVACIKEKAGDDGKKTCEEMHTVMKACESKYNI